MSAARRPREPGAVIARDMLSRMIADGLEDLLVQDRQEIDPDGAPLDIDWDAYQRQEWAGAFKAWTVRAGGRLVGYSAFFLHQSLYRRARRYAINDLIWLHPDHRAGPLGIRLVTEPEAELRALGVHEIEYRCHVSQGGEVRARLGAILERLGYAVTEKVMNKHLV